jgi:hypothetical protein
MYMVLFNNTYKRQFEITIKAETYKKILKRHKNNVPETLEEIFTHFYRKKTTTTKKRHRAFLDFIHYNFLVLGGESYIVMANTKGDYMKARLRERGIGRGGLVVISKGKGEFRAKRRKIR